MPIRLLRPSRRHEAELWAAGCQYVAGVDEVGRGAWAGPLVAAAVVLPTDCKLRGARDSKLLTSLKRQQLAAKIKRQAAGIGVGWATVSEIDASGLTEALRLAGGRALAVIESIDGVLLDGNHNYLGPSYQVKTVIKADNCCLSVAAASIVAKVARDAYMARIHQLYPDYGFDTNVGYGTRRHQKALRSQVSPIHRRLFAPIQVAIDGLD